MVSGPTRASLVRVIADSFDLPVEIVERYQRDLRASGLLPAGRAGRKGSLPKVDTRFATTVILGILASPSARGVSAAFERLSKAEGPALRRYVDGEQYVITPHKTSILDSLDALIDLARAPDVPTSYISQDFTIRVCRTLQDLWAEISIPYPGDNHRRVDCAYFVDPMLSPTIFGLFRREAAIGNHVVQSVAQCLGRFSHDQWAHVKQRFPFEALRSTELGFGAGHA